MATLLKQSTAVDIGIGPFLDETDGKTAETGLTITQPDIQLKKNGGAFAQKNAAQTLAHESNGWYEVALNATDTDTLGELIVQIHEAGALPCWRVFQVVPAAVYDALVSGSGNGVRSDVQAIAANAITAAAIATDAITAAKIAADAITSAKIADNAITAAKINAAAITAAKFAAGALDANALAADAVTEIQSGLALSTQVDALEAAVIAIEADTQDLQARILEATRKGTAQAGTAGGITLDAGASAGAQYYTGSTVRIMSGAGAGQARLIYDYDGATKIASVYPAWVTNPDATSIFEILPMGPADIQLWRENAPNVMVAGRVDVTVGAMAANVMTAAALAADAAAEIADAVLDEDVTTHLGGTKVGEYLRVTVDDTNDIQTRLPATLSSGRIRAAVESIEDTVPTTLIASAVWNALLEAGFSASRIMRIIGSAAAGKVSGAPGSPVFRNLGDTLDQITGTADASGNRTAASYGA